MKYAPERSAAQVSQWLERSNAVALQSVTPGRNRHNYAVKVHASSMYMYFLQYHCLNLFLSDLSVQGRALGPSAVPRSNCSQFVDQ